MGKISMIKWITLAFALWATPVAAQQNCVVPAGFPATPVVSAAVEGSHILKATPGCLIATYVTVGATGGFLMIFNLTTVPGDGAVAPIECIQVAANTTNFLNWAPQPPEWFSTGIVAVFSTTGCFTKTISATAFFHGLVQ
jgi:hypothetical protein